MNKIETCPKCKSRVTTNQNGVRKCTLKPDDPEHQIPQQAIADPTHNGDIQSPPPALSDIPSIIAPSSIAPPLTIAQQSPSSHRPEEILNDEHTLPVSLSTAPTMPLGWAQPPLLVSNSEQSVSSLPFGPLSTKSGRQRSPLRIILLVLMIILLVAGNITFFFLLQSSIQRQAIIIRDDQATMNAMGKDGAVLLQNVKATQTVLANTTGSAQAVAAANASATANALITGTPQATAVVPNPLPQVRSSEPFFVYFIFMNTGQSIWSDVGGYRLACISGHQRAILPSGSKLISCMSSRSSISFNGDTVLPGHQYAFSIKYSALARGNYITYWQLTDKKTLFGPEVAIHIVVTA